jgi:hypothetical protein
MREALDDLIDGFRDFFKILSWFETWVPSLVALGIVGFWFIFAFAICLPNPWRSILLWGIIFGLAILAPKR